MNIAFNTAVSGMITARAQMATASHAVVDASARGEDIVQSIVSLQQAESLHQASAAIARTASDMTETLLDIIV
jgi:predicted component of type VI protein secretion system